MYYANSLIKNNLSNILVNSFSNAPKSSLEIPPSYYFLGSSNSNNGIKREPL